MEQPSGRPGRRTRPILLSMLLVVALLATVGLAPAQTRTRVDETIRALTGWGVWVVTALPPREAAFAVIWVGVSGYFIVAAGTFKTQLGRFETGAGATARHLLQALLWGPIMILMLLPRKRIGE